MKIAAICCTYKRPRELATAVESFLRQDYPAELRELIVLDDAGQYSPTACDHLPGVRLVTTRHRFRTLGEKRNASAAFAAADVDAYFVWDDDDVYLPWHVRAAVAALADADYTIPTRLYQLKKGRLFEKENQYLFHGAWSFRRAAFERVRGYPWIQSGQDQGLLRRFKEAKLRRGDPLQSERRPSYVYRWFNSHKQHISALGRDGYEKLAKAPAEHVATLAPAWDEDWLALQKEAQ